jgi:hypothetical protein
MTGNLLLWIAPFGLLCAFLTACGGEQEELPSREALEALGIDPLGVRCLPKSEQALAVQEPPVPLADASAGNDHASTRLGPLPFVCPAGYLPEYANGAEPPELNSDISVTQQASTVAGDTWFASLTQVRTSQSGYGTGGVISIHNPALYNSSDHSLAQISIEKDQHNGQFYDQYGVVEAGFIKHVDYPRLLIAHWRFNRYRWAEGFVHTHRTYRASMDLRSFVGSGRRFYIKQHNGNWWVYFNDGWVGYFPGSLWNGQFGRGNRSHWFGEVYSARNLQPPRTDMGNGLFPGNTSAASITGLCTFNSSQSCWLHSTSYSPYATNSSYYNVRKVSDTAMRYGGNGGG